MLAKEIKNSCPPCVSRKKKVMAKQNSFARLIGITFLGAMLGAAYARVWRPQFLSWGAVEKDVHRCLPGDALVRDPQYVTTRAITIRASTERVWPWLVQIGFGRGGFYTYDTLENAAGLEIHSANEIHSAWQDLRAGDVIRISPVTPMNVALLDANYALVLHVAMNPFTAQVVNLADPNVREYFDWSWAFALDPVAPTVTRLIVRVRAHYEPTWIRALAIAMLEPIHFVMERGMLQGIKRRAES
jgi:hypothetical protein